jgi:hypothetical protein
MAFKYAERVIDTTDTSGTGTITLNNTVIVGYKLFGSVLSVNDSTSYCIEDPTNGDWEVGVGTLTSSTTFTRNSVISSSNANTLVNFTSNNKNVTLVYPGSRVLIGTGSGGTATPAGTCELFGKSQGGRLMPAFVGPSGLDSVLQPHMAKNGWAQWKPAGNSTTISAIGAAALSATGTATAKNYATTSLHTRTTGIDYLVTTAATTAVAGYRATTAIYRVVDGFHMIFRVAPATGSTVVTGRFFCGMSTSTAAPTDVDPSTLTNSVGVGYAKGTDTNWQVYFGGTAVAKVNTGMVVPAADRTGPYTVIIFVPPGGSYIGVKLVDETTGVSFETTTTTSTNMMAATTASGPRGYHSVGGTSSVVGLTLFSGYIESDN